MKFGALLKFDLYRIGLILLDGLCMVLSMWLGYDLVFDGAVPAPFQQQRPFLLGIAFASTLAVFAFLGLYSRRLPQFGERDARWIVLGALLAEGCAFVAEFAMEPMYWPYLILFWSFLFLGRAGIGVYASYRSAFFPNWQIIAVPTLGAIMAVAVIRLQHIDVALPDAELPISKTVHALYFFFSVTGFLLARWGLHWLFWFYRKPRMPRNRAILIGSDLELLMFARMNEMSNSFKIVGVLDNDPLKWGMRVRETRILGGLPLLGRVASELSADSVLLLKDSLSLEEVHEVEAACRDLRIKLVRLGSLQESLLRADSLSTADLLERKEYLFLPTDKDNYLKGKRVLVTGAGGSIGSELVRQILLCHPLKIILLGRGENSIFELERELNASGQLFLTTSIIVNIADSDGLEEAFQEHLPEIVFHAAAHKHVPLMESNIREAVRNNVMGTQNVMTLAGRYRVQRAVLISTDKAVSPSSVMGATKRKAEQVVVHCSNAFPHTQYSVVRFGNVLGSRGSVVRLFLEQIRKGGPVTVTDPRMTRFFMTIPEAVALVLSTGTLGAGFGIYVLEMGKPYRIADLAEKMIRMCGLEPGRDIEIVYTGVRPGEKMDEILVDHGETLEITSNPQVKVLTSTNSERVVVEAVQVPDLYHISLDALRAWLFQK